jgi:hypothetical protein
MKDLIYLAIIGFVAFLVFRFLKQKETSSEQSFSQLGNPTSSLTFFQPPATGFGQSNITQVEGLDPTTTAILGLVGQNADQLLSVGGDLASGLLDFGGSAFTGISDFIGGFF